MAKHTKSSVGDALDQPLRVVCCPGKPWSTCKKRICRLWLILSPQELHAVNAADKRPLSFLPVQFERGCHFISEGWQTLSYTHGHSSSYSTSPGASARYAIICSVNMMYSPGGVCWQWLFGLTHCLNLLVWKYSLHCRWNLCNSEATFHTVWSCVKQHGMEK